MIAIDYCYFKYYYDLKYIKTHTFFCANDKNEGPPNLGLGKAFPRMFFVKLPSLLNTNCIECILILVKRFVTYYVQIESTWVLIRDCTDLSKLLWKTGFEVHVKVLKFDSFSLIPFSNVIQMLSEHG